MHNTMNMILSMARFTKAAAPYFYLAQRPHSKYKAFNMNRAQHGGGAMRTMEGIMHRLPVKGVDGSIDLIEVDWNFLSRSPGGRHAGPNQEEKALPLRTAAE
jgi:hypothetical protein